MGKIIVEVLGPAVAGASAAESGRLLKVVCDGGSSFERPHVGEDRVERSRRPPAPRRMLAG
jgi:hypothetical protein